MYDKEVYSIVINTLLIICKVNKFIPYTEWITA